MEIAELLFAAEELDVAGEDGVDRLAVEAIAGSRRNKKSVVLRDIR